MTLGHEQLCAVLDRVLPQVMMSQDWAVVLEGSLAEGFGNSTSDLDFLLIAPDEAELPTMPSVLFVDDRRVEVRTRSVGQLLTQFREVAARWRRPGALSEDMLNRCQRLLGSTPLRHPELVARVHEAAVAGLPDGGFAEVVGGWWAHAARQSMRHALALSLLGQGREALDWAQVGLVQAVKSWVAVRGETYLEPKWLALQLERVGEPETARRFWSLDTRELDDSDAAGFLRECVGFATELGVTGLSCNPELLSIHRMAGVTTWQTGERVQVIRARHDVFALGHCSGRAWRSVVFGRSLPSVLAAARQAGGRSAGPVLADFLRFGLLRLHWRGQTVTPRAPMAAPTGPMTPPPSPVSAVITVGGARVRGADAVDLLPMPADRFSAAAMNLVWSNVVLENLAEDLAGALGQRQWRSADLAARRLLQVGLRAVLSAHGVAPLPPDTELVGRLAVLPECPGALTEAVARLSTLSIRGADDVATVRGELACLVALVRRVTGTVDFPSSFESAAAWQATVDTGYDWLRLGAYLNATLPLDEARDLLATAGAQPHLRAAGDGESPAVTALGIGTTP